MFQLKVVGLDEAEMLVYCFWPTCIVSLTSNETINWNYVNHLHVRVNDVATDDGNAIAPALHHVHTVLEFTKNLTSVDRLLVHCFAGQSRSTAMAIAICIQHGMNYKEAFDHVASIRTILMPNTLFIKHIDRYFDLDDQLVDYAEARRIESLKRTLILPSGPPPQKDVERMMELLKMLDNA